MASAHFDGAQQMAKATQNAGEEKKNQHVNVIAMETEKRMGRGQENGNERQTKNGSREIARAESRRSGEYYE